MKFNNIKCFTRIVKHCSECTFAIAYKNINVNNFMCSIITHASKVSIRIETMKIIIPYRGVTLLIC